MCTHACLCFWLAVYSTLCFAAVPDDQPMDLEGYQKLKDKVHRRFDNLLPAADTDEDEDEEEEDEDDDGDKGPWGNEARTRKSAVPWKGKHVSSVVLSTLL